MIYFYSQNPLQINHDICAKTSRRPICCSARALTSDAARENVRLPHVSDFSFVIWKYGLMSAQSFGCSCLISPDRSVFNDENPVIFLKNHRRYESQSDERESRRVEKMRQKETCPLLC